MSEDKYDFIENLEKLGLFFKYLFYTFLIVVLIFLVYLFSFKLKKTTPLKVGSDFKKAVFSISFSSKKDYENSQKYLKDYDLIFYNKTNSGFIPLANGFRPVFNKNINGKGIVITDTELSSEALFDNNKFYVFKHYSDKRGYSRGNIFKPVLEELYNGKIVFEHFFSSYVDLFNLIAGIIFSDDLYAFKYSEEIKKIVFETIKKRRTFMLSSYGNKDSSTHKNLLRAYSIYYKGDFKEAVKNGDYFLANELAASGKYFVFSLRNDVFGYDINFKENIFFVYIFKDGQLIKKINKLHCKVRLDRGFYNIVILKSDGLFSKEIFWIYLNFKI